MKLSDFDFDLPERLIATRPARPRSASRLLVVDKAGLSDRQFAELPDILRPGDRLVLNDTKVIPARLFGLRHRDSQQGAVTARIEVLLLTPEADGHVWQAMVKPLKKIQVGERIEFDPDFGARLLERSDDGTARLEFDCAGEAFDAALARAGQMPLPPYIASKRAADERDREDYQTIWAAEKGAIAAPTASLHFDAAVMDALAARGVEVSHVTLHVGAGTFLPVKVEDISRHKMHSEWGRIPAKAAGEINATRAAGGRIIAVGTTALRLIESAADDNGHLSAWTGETDIFIRPGHRFKITDGLITNFHLPKSSLLMLVSALMGLERMQAAYRHAIAHGYRFFSYGDASLLLPDDEVADNAAGPA